MLTKDQENALIELNKWIDSKESFFKLIGSAGTGKTFLVNEFISQIKRGISIAITAPTHKAKKELNKKTGLVSHTIQSLCGLRPNVEVLDFDINNPLFEVIANPTINNYDLILLDEASMLNKELYILICDTAIRYKVKILFIGDNLQINPINETESIALTDSNTKGVELKEIVRQSNSNPVNELLFILREDIINNTTKFKDFLNEEKEVLNDKGEGYIITKSKEKFASYFNVFESDIFKQDKSNVKYITWTNESIGNTSPFIRKIIFKDSSTNPFLIGEVLLSYNTIFFKDKPSPITNSDDYEILDIREYTNEYKLEGYLVRLKNLDITQESEIFVVKESSYSLFKEIHNNLLEKAKSYVQNGWKNYYAFKNNHILSKDIKEGNKLIVKKDIDYGYGISVHKSQGSTYNTILVNGKDIDKNSKLYEKLRLWYVALSRTSNKVIIYG